MSTVYALKTKIIWCQKYSQRNVNYYYTNKVGAKYVCKIQVPNRYIVASRRTSNTHDIKKEIVVMDPMCMDERILCCTHSVTGIFMGSNNTVWQLVVVSTICSFIWCPHKTRVAVTQLFCAERRIVDNYIIRIYRKDLLCQHLTIHAY